MLRHDKTSLRNRFGAYALILLAFFRISRRKMKFVGLYNLRKGKVIPFVTEA